MSKKKVFIISIAAFILLLAGAFFLYQKLSAGLKPQLSATQNQSSESTDETQKVKAPDFTVTDTEGNEVNLSDFIGKPVVLNFWASWCGPCQSEMPHFNELYQERKDDVHFLMVNMTDGSRETLDTAKSYIEGQGFAFPVYYDTKSDAAITYQVYSLPTTYFIDREGYAVAKVMGAIDKETLQTGISMIDS
jgi:thiol-disulfide isomerase/thioredoxin